MLILYSSMLRIPEEMFEAAEIDGATELHKIRYIVFPFMMPVISVLVVLTIANEEKKHFNILDNLCDFTLAPQNYLAWGEFSNLKDL